MNKFAILLFTLTTSVSAQSLYDPETGKYLGRLSANPYDADSTSNPYGEYGSKYSPNSINNPYGEYGSPYSDKSVNNPYATNAPIIRDDSE